jgi:hypothetical protein
MISRQQFLFLGLCTVGAGCGGGSIDPLAPVTPKIRVRWPALGRAVEATPYAMSVRVVLTAASLKDGSQPPFVNGGDVVILANRSGIDAYEAVYTADQPIRPGFVRASIQFMSDPNGRGRELRTGTLEVEPDSEGFLPDISMKTGSGEIKSISLGMYFFEQEVPFKVNDLKSLLISVTDKNSLGLYLSIEEDLKWNVEHLEPERGPVVELLPATVFPGVNNRLRGLRPGTATVRVSVDGVQSEPLVVTVVPADS